MPVILATQEAEIRKITVWVQLWKKISQTPISTTNPELLCTTVIPATWEV
jgi:hypothetical protein